MTSKKLVDRRAPITILFAFSLAFSISTMLIPRTTAQTTYYVTIELFAFNPDNLTIKPGDTVVWTNNDPVIYTLWFVRVSDGSTYLLSDPIAPGATWAYTFTEEVNLQYFDLERLWITGFLNVVLVHDVAVTNILPYQTVVGQGFSTKINVTVQNQGEVPETFNLALYLLGTRVPLSLGASASTGWNNTQPGPTITVNLYDDVKLTLVSTDGLSHQFHVDYSGNGVPDPGEPLSPVFRTPAITYEFIANTPGTFTYYCTIHPVTMVGTFIVNPTPTSTLIGVQPVGLNPLEERTLTFLWSSALTSTMPKGIYTLSAVADLAPGEIDVDPTDNTFTDGTVILSIPCDVAGSTTTPPAPPDGRVDYKDVFWLLKAYGSDPTKPNWNPNLDFAGSTTTPPAPPDGRVNYIDVFWLLKNYGKIDP